MKRALALLLLLAPLALAQKTVAEFRLNKDPSAVLRGWILEYDDDGFQFQRFGGGRRILVDWDDLLAEDRNKLRQTLKLDLSEEEKLGLLDGHRLHLKGGATVDGLLEKVDEQQRHWMRQEGHLLPYPADRVARVEERKVKATDIYNADEAYLKRMERVLPKGARQHRELAKHLEGVGNFERALQHYEEAVAMRPSWKAELEPTIRGLRDLLKDKNLSDFLKGVRSSYRLNKDYDGARAALQRYIDEHPEHARAATRVLDDLEEHADDDRRARVHLVKHDEFDDLIDDFLKNKPEIDEAMAWAQSGLREELHERLRKRLGLTKEEVAELLAKKPGSSPHWATYDHGTFVVSKRAKKGASSSKVIRGDPNTWWRGFAKPGMKSHFLKAFAVERLPELFEVVEVRTRDCSRCGGKGQVKHVSVQQLAGGGHEWWQTCPRCFGAKRDRSVGYR